MNATLLCAALLVPGYGEEDTVKRIEHAGGGLSPARVIVVMPVATTDDELYDLCELRHLKDLFLTRTKISDRGLRTVSALRWLRKLYLDQTAITDEGLLHLESLSNLHYLNLDDCRNITDQGVARLQKALPKCQIVR
jgi:hypothetical protein